MHTNIFHGPWIVQNKSSLELYDLSMHTQLFSVYHDIWSYNSYLGKIEETEQRYNIYDRVDFDYWNICKKQSRRRNRDVLSLIPGGTGLKITNTPPIFRYIISQQIYILLYLLHFYAITSRHSCEILGSDRHIFYCPE